MTRRPIHRLDLETMRVLRIYIDTSVIGGCLDVEFEEASNALLDLARNGAIVLVVSDVLLDELGRAPEEVRSLLVDVSAEHIEPISESDDSRQLRDAYLLAQVVGPGSKIDAHHVALATVARADLIVSWNFRHIVHVDKIRRFNAVNLMEGHTTIDIRSPREVV